jgi:HSP20 family protein
MTRRYELMPISERFMSIFPEFDMFDRFFSDLSLPDLFRRERVMMPAFDISETENEYVISGEIPGMEAKDIDITLTDGCLTVKGEKKQEKEDKDENYHRVERHYGSFQRSFGIPSNVNTENLEATYKEGILRLALPKSEKSDVKKIEVKAKNSRKRVKTKKS